MAGRSCLLALAVAALLAGCGGSSGAPLDLQSCVVGGSAARCGTLRVPESPGEPGGRRIPLKVVVFPATGGHPKADPVFWFAGWGGAGATDDAANGASWLASANVDRDLVFVDQRGTGSSQLLCDVAGLTTPAQLTAAARRCAARIGPNFRYYTSAIAVDDVDLVRQALGYDTIDLYGASYGVTTEQVYLLRHGAHVRAAVMDSGSLLDVRIFEQEAPNAQRALDLLFARCARDILCDGAYPRLRQEYAQVLARLARGPIAIPGTGNLDLRTFASVLDEMLTDASGKAQIPRLIDLLANGRAAEAVLDALQEPPLTSVLAYMGLIQCSEPWASWRPAALARTTPGTFLRPVMLLDAKASAAVCKVFPQGYAPAAVGRRVHSNVPILFLTGNEDPADPPANVAHAARELPNSRTVIFAGSGHGQIGLPCAQQLVARFLDRGTARGLDASCARGAALVPFDIGF